MTPYKLIPLALILILEVCPVDAKEWTKEEKTGAGFYIAGNVINYFQIDYALNTPGWHETSWHIREIHDEAGMLGVAAWKIGTTFLVLKAADKWPKARPWILGGSNGVVWHFVISDRMNGVGFSFTWK